MRRTYAYSSIGIGAVLGVLVVALTDSLPLGIITLIVVAVVGFIAIRALENLIYKGVNTAANAAASKVQEAYRKHKENQNGENR